MIQKAVVAYFKAFAWRKWRISWKPVKMAMGESRTITSRINVGRWRVVAWTKPLSDLLIYINVLTIGSLILDQRWQSKLSSLLNSLILRTSMPRSSELSFVLEHHTLTDSKPRWIINLPMGWVEYKSQNYVSFPHFAVEDNQTRQIATVVWLASLTGREMRGPIKCSSLSHSRPSQVLLVKLCK